MAQARSARAINRRGKSLVRKLRYGPQTRLVRGIYVFRGSGYPDGASDGSSKFNMNVLISLERIIKKTTETI